MTGESAVAFEDPVDAASQSTAYVKGEAPPSLVAPSAASGRTPKPPTCITLHFHGNDMAIGPGVTEIADSDEEPLTSSPAANEDTASDKHRMTAGQDIQAVACPDQETTGGVANNLSSRTVCLDVDQQQPSPNPEISRLDQANSQPSNQTTTNYSTCTTNDEQANLPVSQVGSDTAVAELQREIVEQHDEGNGSIATQDTRRLSPNESRTLLEGPASMPVEGLAKPEIQGEQPQGKNGSTQETAAEQLIPLEETNTEMQAATAGTVRIEHGILPVHSAEAVAEQVVGHVATSFTESFQPLHQHHRGIDGGQTLVPMTPRSQAKSPSIASQARQSLSPPPVSQLTPQEITLVELKAQKAGLLASLKKLPAIQVLIERTRTSNVGLSDDDAEPTDAEVHSAANRIVKEHIKLLHEYNELKDVGQGMMGLIADQRGSRIAEVQEEFGIDVND
ncbi:hypothetical protein B5807_10278 [Epicoccum nigrum]|uniref:Swi5-domain-containing protein n=1 Tax=Epicoccum nigrum TaxID=105696 RepID=A0A1Y2LNJ4_EPING|nr:hypothetical protein B5807_10278 [Epicoccum nigrum]